MESEETKNLKTLVSSDSMNSSYSAFESDDIAAPLLQKKKNSQTLPGTRDVLLCCSIYNKYNQLQT
jgi:hypothetical protein